MEKPLQGLFILSYPSTVCLADFILLTLDEAILVELGNSAGYSDEEKPQFVAGLKNLLQDLRMRKIKDFQIIASEIAAFRAEFRASHQFPKE